MTELVRVYGEDMPRMRFVGRRYGEGDAVGGGYGHKWGEWFGLGLFGPLEALLPGQRAGFEDDGAYIGLMRHKPGEPSEYWIGMFLAADAAVPEGYDAVDFPPRRVGIAWLHGPESELYSQEDLALNGLHAAGFAPLPDEKGACWFMERYACPRFTEADAAGNVVLDIGVFA